MKNRKSPKNNTDSGGYRYSDMGLEPPKLYRDEQSSFVQRQRRAPEQMTRQQRREKQNHRRRLKRSVRKALVITGLVVLMAAIVVVLSLTVFFKIDTISISGCEKYTNEEILTAFTIDKGENLFLADTDKASEKLCETLPYIYSAEINRKLPATITVKITQAAPAYTIQNKDKQYVVLDNRFKVLDIQKSKPEGTVQIKKAEIKSAQPGQRIVFSNEKISDCLAELAKALSTYSLSEATAIYSEGINSNYIVYDNRITFKLGSCDDMEKKIYQGLAACEELDASNPTVKGTLTLTGDKQYYFTEE